MISLLSAFLGRKTHEWVRVEESLKVVEIFGKLLLCSSCLFLHHSYGFDGLVSLQMHSLLLSVLCFLLGIATQNWIRIWKEANNTSQADEG
jgi:hypothetical protein